MMDAETHSENTSASTKKSSPLGSGGKYGPHDTILQGLISQIVEKTKGDLAAAEAELIRQGYDNKELYQQIVEPFYEHACHQAIARYRQAQRDSAWNGGTNEAGNKTAMQRRKAHAKRGMRDFILPGINKSLGMSTHEEIAEAIKHYTIQIDSAALQIGTMRHERRWLELINEIVLPDTGKTTDDMLNDAKLRKLQAKAAEGK